MNATPEDPERDVKRIGYLNQSIVRVVVAALMKQIHYREFLELCITLQFEFATDEVCLLHAWPALDIHCSL